mgnify:CR=1 FL=1
MKRFLAVALSACLLMLCTVFIAPTMAQEPLPTAYVDVEGLAGYKAYVYQDFSDDGLSMWVNNSSNTYTIENGQLAITKWAAWTQGKIEQAGHSIRDIESNAAQGYGFYIKQTASQWIRPLYYIADGNKVVTPPGETEYILVPADGSEPVTGTMRASGDFLLSGAFEGYVLVKLPLSTLEGFSPFAMVGGNLNVSQSAPVYFDNFLIWAEDPEAAATDTPAATTPAATDTSAATTPAATQTASEETTASADTTTAAGTTAAATQPVSQTSEAPASASALPTPDLSDMVKLQGLAGYRAFVYEDFSNENITIWQSEDYNKYSIENGQLAVSQASGQAWTQAKVEQKGKEISQDVYNAAEGYGFYIKNNGSGQWIRPYSYISESNQVITPPGESEYILVPADGSEPVKGVMRASGDFLLPANFEGYVLVELPLSELDGFSPYAFFGGNLRADGEYGTLYYDNFMVWMKDTDNTGSNGDASILIFAAACAAALCAAAAVGAKKRFSNK